MEQTEFLDQNVFTDLTNVNEGDDAATNPHFSEADFEIVLQRAEHFGLGVYKIESMLKGESNKVASYEDFKKKATDHRWYKAAFRTFKSSQAGLTYAATYKVSNKLLAREAL